MNFFEVFLFALLSGAMVFVGTYLSAWWGPVGWLVILPIAYFWLKLISGSFRSLVTGMRERSRPRPPCRTGKCQSRDYVLVDPRPGSTIFRCRCGDMYLSQGTYFSFMAQGGSPQPYMKLDRSGEWKSDNGQH